MDTPSAARSLKAPSSSKSAALDSLLSLPVTSRKGSRNGLLQSSNNLANDMKLEFEGIVRSKEFNLAFQDETNGPNAINKRKEKVLILPNSALKVGKYRTIIEHNEGASALLNSFRKKNLRSDISSLNDLGTGDRETSHTQQKSALVIKSTAKSKKLLKKGKNHQKDIDAISSNVKRNSSAKKSNVIMDMWNIHLNQTDEPISKESREQEYSLDQNLSEIKTVCKRRSNEVKVNFFDHSQGNVDATHKTESRGGDQNHVTAEWNRFMKNLKVGSLVSVKGLSSPYRPGGVGRIINILSDDMFCVQYVLGGKEKNVNVERIEKVPSDQISLNENESSPAKKYNLRKRSHQRKKRTEKPSFFTEEIHAERELKVVAENNKELLSNAASLLTAECAANKDIVETIEEKSGEKESKINSENSPELSSNTASFLAAVNGTSKQIIEMHQPIIAKDSASIQQSTLSYFLHDSNDNETSNELSPHRPKDLFGNAVGKTNPAGFSIAHLNKIFSLVRNEMQNPFFPPQNNTQLSSYDFVTQQHINCRRSKLDLLTLQRNDLFQRMNQLHSEIKASMKKIRGEIIASESNINAKKSKKSSTKIAENCATLYKEEEQNNGRQSKNLKDSDVEMVDDCALSPSKVNGDEVSKDSHKSTGYENKEKTRVIKRRSRSASGRKHLKPLPQTPKKSKSEDSDDSDDATYTEGNDKKSTSDVRKIKKAESYVDVSEDSDHKEYDDLSSSENKRQKRSISRGKKAQSISNRLTGESHSTTFSKNEKKTKDHSNNISKSKTRSFKRYNNYSEEKRTKSFSADHNYFKKQRIYENSESQSYESTSSSEDKEKYYHKEVKSNHVRSESYSSLSDESMHHLVKVDKEAIDETSFLENKVYKYHPGRRTLHSKTQKSVRGNMGITQYDQYIYEKRLRKQRKKSVDRDRYHYFVAKKDAYQDSAENERSREFKSSSKRRRRSVKDNYVQSRYNERKDMRSVGRTSSSMNTNNNRGSYRIPSNSFLNQSKSLYKRRSVSPSNAHSILEDI